MKIGRTMRYIIVIAMTVVLCVASFAATVSAGTEEVFNNSQLPWRGSWAASIYLYAKAWTDANLPQPDMNVRAHLMHWNGSTWDDDGWNDNVVYNGTHVDATARVYHPSGGTFTTYSEHWGHFRIPEGEYYYRARWCGEPSW